MGRLYPSKPPFGSVINWGHPLSRYIAGCWLLSECAGVGRDISKKNKNVITNVGGAVWRKEGISFDGANGTHSTISGGSQPSVEVYGGNVYWLCIRFKASALGGVLYGQTDSSGGGYSKRILLNATYNRIDFYLGGTVTCSTPDNSIVVGKEHVILFTSTTGGYNEKMHIYLDCLPLVSSGYGQYSYDAGETPYLGDSYNNQPYSGLIKYFLSFKNPAGGSWTVDYFGKRLAQNLYRDPYFFIQRPTFRGVAVPRTCVLSGSAMAGINEADIRTGGKELVLTLAGDTWASNE